MRMPILRVSNHLRAKQICARPVATRPDACASDGVIRVGMQVRDAADDGDGVRGQLRARTDTTKPNAYAEGYGRHRLRVRTNAGGVDSAESRCVRY